MKADFNVKDRENETALDMACQRKDEKSFIYLKCIGAKEKSKCQHFKSPDNCSEVLRL